MNVRRWGFFGALLGVAAFAGCDDMQLDSIPDEQQDVIEEQQDVIEEEQDVREEEAELRDAEAQQGTPPALGQPGANPFDTAPPAGSETPADQPEVTDPEAGTINEPGGTAGEGAVSPEPTDEAGSEGQGTDSEEPEPALPQ